MSRKVFLYLVILFTTTIITPIFSQTKADTTYSVKGIVVDSISSETIPYATISVAEVTKPDIYLKRLATESDGAFNITLNKTGDYFLTFESTGLEKKQIKITIIAGQKKLELGKILLSPSQLSEVTVMAIKPLVKVDMDKISYDMKSDPEAQSSNTLDMLRKVPMVTVDGEDKIQLKGSSNFKIYVNGKPSGMMTNNPSQVLKSIPASSIKKIEVITDPGAKYDAEGGYVIDGIHNPELIKAALRLNPGEMTREPLLISGSLYIIKVFDHAILTPGNIEKLIHDKSQAGRISRHLKLNAVRELESRLSAQPDVVNNIGKVSLLRKDSVLFRIGASAFTAGAFDKELNFSESNRKAAGLDFKTPDLNRKAFILNKLFRDKLLEREALRSGIDKDKQFIKEWRALQDSVLISFFRNKQITRSSELSIGLNADKTGKNRETFNRVKRIEAIHKWEQDLLQRNHFVVL